MDQVTVPRELLRQAEELLSSLITYDWHNKPKEDIDKEGYECAEAIRAALEQPAVEPEKTNAKESNADVDFCSNAAINEQRRNMVGEVEVGQSLGNGQHQSTGNSEPQGAVAVITGFDEYGPFLGWHTHWANLPVGARLYTAPQAQQPTNQFNPDWDQVKPFLDRIAELEQELKTTTDALGHAQRQHVTDGSVCWCNPTMTYKDPDTGAEVWVHQEPQ